MRHLVSPSVQVIRGQELEHEQQQVDGERDQHGLVLGVLLHHDGSASDKYFRVNTSVFSLAWGLLHHTQLPTPAPVMARPDNIPFVAHYSSHL